MITSATPTSKVEITPMQPLATWFGVGGGAARYARPTTAEQLAECVALDPALRVIGDGANLLVDDDGVPDLVVSLTQGDFVRVQREQGSDVVRVGAGVNLPKLILECVRDGLGGLEGLGGIPATVGGAVVMNAGGAFGQIADCVHSVHAVDRLGRRVRLHRGDIAFGYRTSGLNDLIITCVDLRLTPGDAGPLRERLKEVMEYKKRSQPMADRSAGCVFKNPTLTSDLEGIGAAGQRVSAGMLIDRAGLKGLRVGGASVSERHANFIVTDPGTAKARDVIELMTLVARRVHEAMGVRLHREVVVWSRHGVCGEQHAG